MKHIFVFKSLCLFFCVFASYNVKAQGSFVVDNIKYFYESSTSTTVSVIWNNNSGDIIIPDSVSNNGMQYRVTSIGSQAFESSVRLTSITIPNSVTTIGNYAFYECSALTSFSIPGSVTSIGSFAFSVCSRITSITIPNSVISIGDAAFSVCNSLTSITIPNSVTSFGTSAFSDCYKLTSIIIPSSITTIADYAFWGDTALNSVTIPSSVTSIQDFAFCNCSSLTSITIPIGVTSIGGSAFSGCGGLNSITSFNPEPPPIDTTTFSGLDFIDCIIYVPIGSIPNYKNATGWTQFAHYKEIGSMNVDITTPNSVKVYTEADCIVVKGVGYGEKINVYNESGTQLNMTEVQNNIVRIKLPPNHFYIIQIGQMVYKVNL